MRPADVDNPRGYFELEKVKRIKEDASWLPEARGKVFPAAGQDMRVNVDGLRHRSVSPRKK